MKLKKICCLSLILALLSTTISFANIDENEQIDFPKIRQELIQTSASVNLPDINSRAAIVLERTTKTVLYGKCENDLRKMASTTKIMTAIVVIENANLYNTVTVSKEAASVGGSTLGIKKGDKITVCDLLYGLLLQSGNDAAVALAEHVGGSITGFSEMMNNKAQELGLNNTHFVTPHGLDNDSHYTTAYELAILTDYALNNQTFYNFVSTKSYTITINCSPKAINNTNELLGNLNGIYGVKTGFTNGANRCLVTACKRDNLDIICVVLGADTKKFRTQDSIKLIEYTYKNFQMIDLEKFVSSSLLQWKSENIDKFNIVKGVNNNLDLELKDFYYTLYPVNKKDINSITSSIECEYHLDAPIKENTVIGSMFININEECVLKYDIVNTNNIEKKGCFYYIQEILSNYFRYLTICN